MTCVGYNIGTDALNAADELINLCGNGYYYGTRSISIQYNSAVAYGCNYGGGQTCHAGDLQGFFDQIFGTCGDYAAGYYEKPEWAAAYGVTATSSGFC